MECAPGAVSHVLRSDDPGDLPSSAIRAFAVASRQAGSVVHADLWFHDVATSTFRHLSSADGADARREPVPQGTEPFASAAFGGHGVLDSCDPTIGTAWQYVAPVMSSLVQGVAVIGFSGNRPETALMTRLHSRYAAALGAQLESHLATQKTATAEALISAIEDLPRLLEPAEVAHALLEHAMSLSGAHTGSVMLRDEWSGVLRIAAAKGLPAEVRETTEVAEGEGVAGWVMATRTAIVIEDLPERGPHSRRHGVCSAVSVPIADKNGLLGVLNVGSRTYPSRSMRDHLAALEGLGRVGAVAIRNATVSDRSRALCFDTLKALVLALETKDPFSHGATGKVVELTTLLGVEMGLNEQESEALNVASLLHDIGMDAAGGVVSVSDRPLSTVEHAMVKMHPLVAVDVLKQVPALADVVPIVYHHHEHYDGAGYVAGLSGQSIPIGARILSVADAYTAMTSDRPYRRALTVDCALSELQDKSGSQFDPSVVNCLARLVEQGAVESHSAASPGATT